MPIDKELLREMYYRLRRIRRFEETAQELYKRGIVVGLLHLYIGEEAVATGVCMALNDDDYITNTHRGHGHLIAKGGDVRRLLAELCGRVTGYCRGKGGSMHAADLSLGTLGANGIVGGGMGIATGAALSAKKRNSGQVTVCFFGDGAANQGIFMEVLNIGYCPSFSLMSLFDFDWSAYPREHKLCRPRVRKWTGKRSIVLINAVDTTVFRFDRAKWSKMAPVMVKRRHSVRVVGVV